ncbi:MAG: DUF3300 domain-containing protein [Proteobacteria bacterium]|nr:DUF3300 domain-containing protein [Pseudomonadota bacterium]
MLILLPWPSFGVEETNQTFSQQEIEQLVAPIALYPDPLLAQILMASTYPLEIVSAARWIKDNPHLKDKALEDALKQESWDPSVKSLTAVPDVLNMLNDKLDMTTKLGDAFLAQQKTVLDAVQALRTKAQASGNLKSSKEQVVKISEQTSSSPQDATQNYISIEPANPEVLYVPVYNPSTVYGEWPYPDFPPYSYYPANFYPAGSFLAFGTATAVGSALWGQLDWANHNVNINANQFYNFNHDRINNDRWVHNPEHRGNVPYRDQISRDNFGKNQLENEKARDSFRDQAEQGRHEISEGGKGALQNMEREGQLREQRTDQARDLGQSAKMPTQSKELKKGQSQQRDHQQSRQRSKAANNNNRRGQVSQPRQRSNANRANGRGSFNNGGRRSGGGHHGGGRH